MISPTASASWFGAAWLAGAVLLWWGARVGVHDPACASYGTVCAGDLRFMLGWMTAEVLLLGAVLRIWWPVPRWRLARGVGLGVLVLLVLSFPVTMHQGAVSTMHLRWLALLGVIAFLAWRRYRPRAPAA